MYLLVFAHDPFLKVGNSFIFAALRVPLPRHIGAVLQVLKGQVDNNGIFKSQSIHEKRLLAIKK